MLHFNLNVVALGNLLGAKFLLASVDRISSISFIDNFVNKLFLFSKPEGMGKNTK